MSVYLKSDRNMYAPIPGTPFTNGKALYLAEFGSGNTGDLVGVFTAAGDGLKSRGWEGTASALGVTSGRVVRGTNLTGNWSLQLPIEGSGAMFAMDVVTLPTVAGLYFDLFRSAVLGSPDGYRLEFTGTGYVRLCRRLAGGHFYFGTPLAIVAGDRVAIRWVGGSLSLIVNGAEKIIANTSDVARIGYCGISGVKAATGFELDNLMVTTY